MFVILIKIDFIIITLIYVYSRDFIRYRKAEEIKITHYSKTQRKPTYPVLTFSYFFKIHFLLHS